MGQCFFCEGWRPYEPCGHDMAERYCHPCFVKLHDEHTIEVTVPGWVALFDSKEKLIAHRGAWGPDEAAWNEALRLADLRWST